MLKLDLKSEDMRQIQFILQHIVPRAEVWAYGSRVKGSNHDASDLDLVIRNPSALQKPIEQLTKLREAFRDSDLPLLIDMMDWAYLPENYRAEIEKLHVVIHP